MLNNNYFVKEHQALKLKQLGFNEPCLKIMNINGVSFWKGIEVDDNDVHIDIKDIINRDIEHPNFMDLPTYEQAFRFFDKKKVVYSIESKIDDIFLQESIVYTVKVFLWNDKKYMWQDFFENEGILFEEEALSECLDALIEAYFIITK